MPICLIYVAKKEKTYIKIFQSVVPTLIKKSHPLFLFISSCINGKILQLQNIKTWLQIFVSLSHEGIWQPDNFTRFFQLEIKTQKASNFLILSTLNNHRGKVSLKIKGHTIFDFSFFVNHIPLSLPITPFRFFKTNLRRYSQLKVHRRCQQHWQVSFTLANFPAGVNNTDGHIFLQFTSIAVQQK